MDEAMRGACQLAQTFFRLHKKSIGDAYNCRANFPRRTTDITYMLTGTGLKTEGTSADVAIAGVSPCLIGPLHLPRSRALVLPSVSLMNPRARREGWP
jgi:hypothetical protein